MEWAGMRSRGGGLEDCRRIGRAGSRWAGWMMHSPSSAPGRFAEESFPGGRIIWAVRRVSGRMRRAGTSVPGAWSCCAVAWPGRAAARVSGTSLGLAGTSKGPGSLTGGGWPVAVIAITTRHIVINLDILHYYSRIDWFFLLQRILECYRVDPVFLSHGRRYPSRDTDRTNTPHETPRRKSSLLPVCLLTSKCALGSRHPDPSNHHHPRTLDHSRLAARCSRRRPTSLLGPATQDHTQPEPRWRGDEGRRAPAP